MVEPSPSAVQTRRLIRARINPPPLPTPLVSRPRVEQLLTRLIEEYPRVCVYATAGAGKTTAVLQAARASGRPIAWLTVTSTDAATGQLLTYLEAAIARQVPDVLGVAAGAMAAGVPHTEVAGLLAEQIGDVPLLMVIDELEKLIGADSAAAVLESFLRYLPPTVRIVLTSRDGAPFALGSHSISGVVSVDDAVLAFTLEEAGQALAAAGSTQADPDEAMKATGGWVTGVLFEAWRSPQHVRGVGGEADPLHGYLSLEILDRLPHDESDFLVSTSVLDQVTATAAEALGIPDPGVRLRALRRRHLPVSWVSENHTMRCHPRFREYLLELLERRPAAEVKQLRRRHAGVLAAQGHYEEAVTEYLEAGALDEALLAAEQCLTGVAERFDLQLAEQWLKALAPARKSRLRLATAELLLAVGSEDYRRAVDLADELEASNELENLARSESRAAALVAWSYMHAGELAKARRVLSVAPPGAPVEAMRYSLTLMEERRPSSPPTLALSGDSFDALVMRVHYYRGYFGLIMGHQLTGWAERAAASWRIAASLAMGSAEDSFRLFEAATESGAQGVWYTGILAVRIMSKLGRLDDAREILRAGRTGIRQSGSLMLEMFSYLEEAELELGPGGDATSAHAALTHVLGIPVVSEYRFVREHALTLLALELLREGDAASASSHLREVVDAAHRADRVYSLTRAGVYLAEAEWQLGHPDDADRAADIALDAANRQGTNHTLQQALTEFPGVLSRRLDAESMRDSPWHSLARAWEEANHDAVPAPVRPALGQPEVLLVEFGRVGLSVNGTEIKPRIKKSYELLAFLIDNRLSDVTKDELVDALFAGRINDSNRSYLRQAVHHLRQALPPGITLEAYAGRLRFEPGADVSSDSIRFATLATEAAALRGAPRLDAMLHALELVDRGDYLPGVTSPWAEEHRAEVADRATTMRFEAAETAHSLNEILKAEELVDRVLRDDPFHEPAYRLAMRLADAVGDERRIISAFRRCEQALNGMGANPSATTTELFARLHR